ncbi:cytochrome c oxidase assembly protein [Streptomyces sp. NPDC005931]|uniref:cytochrome c oxidase assembly protein n=1 Tax=Streptomyces sp. NPDC005931 TaxID=3364737 RepID=UPI0036CE1520
MTPARLAVLAHVHPGQPTGGPGPAGTVVVVAAVSVTLLYLVAAGRLRRRGDAWPWGRDVAFAAGGTGIVWATAGTPPGGPFTGHMVHHVVVGMLAPLLLVLGRPVTLALRALAPGRMRRGLVAVAHSRAVGWLLFPPLAALVDVGGLWLLYRTELFAAVQQRPAVAAATHAHVAVTGVLFAFAVCSLDPVRRRWGHALRGGTLLAAGAAHAVLAKTLYAVPPPGTAFDGADLRTGARVMYYGGDVAEAALAVVLAAGWYAARGRTAARRARRGAAAPVAAGQALRPRAVTSPDS